MRHICQWLRGKRDVFILAGLLLFFVSGLYGIGGLFTGMNTKPRLTIIPESLVSQHLTPPSDSAFLIESATKQSNRFAMYGFWVADSNTILLNSIYPAFQGVRLSLLHMDDNAVQDIVTNTDYGVDFTYDRTKIVYTRYKQDRKGAETFSYDWKNGVSQKLDQNQAYKRLFLNENVYVGYDDTGYMEVDLSSGKERRFYTHEELASRLSRFTASVSDNEVLALPDSMAISKDQKHLYMIVSFRANDEAIYRYSLKDDQDDELFIRAEEILQYALLNNGDFMLMGRVDGTSGIFLYDPGEKEYEVLLKGDFLGFEWDESRSRLAYIQMLDGQWSKNELHVAYLRNNRLQSDTIIYRNVQDFYKLAWWEDSLFVGGSTLDSSEIYRFTFKVW
ncbi:hypothetical protein [Paenibacillus sanguinis]|uniref:hypothetical protein n=1 Tax=Paenibacillus sanguinis TaxID=225906 RepID=UPI00037E465D|nr:hypothetical protein [Paenibacillus sanguinis]